MARSWWILGGIGAILLVAAAATAVGLDEVRERGAHDRLERACHADPTVHDRCAAVLGDRCTDREPCERHTDRATDRCTDRDHCDRETDRASDRCTDREHCDRETDGADDRAERQRRYCAAHPDDRRCQ